MSDFEYGGELVAEDWPLFTMVPTWLLFVGCTAQAYRMYAFLAQHIYSGQRRTKDRIACPKQTAIAHVLRLKNPRQVGDYAQELERLGALVIQEYRYAGGMRRGYRYHLRFAPPAQYTGPASIGDFYERYPSLNAELWRERRDEAPTAEAVRRGGTKNSTSGGTKNSTTEGAENSTTRGPVDSTAHRPTGGTARDAVDSRAHLPTDGTALGAMDGTARGPWNSTAKEEAPVEASEEAPPPPPPVGKAEAARGRASEEEGAASPHAFSPAAAGGTAGASPTTSPYATIEPRYFGMARDVVARLPRQVQPGTDDERVIAVQLVAGALAQGHQVPDVVRELSGNMPEQVAAKGRFIAARLNRMAPPAPIARPVADTAALRMHQDAVQHRADDSRQHERAAEARALMAAARRGGPASPTQQQEAGGGTPRS